MDRNNTDPERSWKLRQQRLREHYFPFYAKISRYEVIGKIGDGSFGQVFVVRDKLRSGEFMAMKKIFTNTKSQEVPVLTLFQLRRLQTLQHQNLVTLLDYFHNQEEVQEAVPMTIFYLITEFCDYNISSLISDNHLKFSLGEIKMILKQLFNGLCYIHSRNIVHRDLKPSDILITRKGVLKLSDMGITSAFNLNGIERLAHKVRTLTYCPPEILFGEDNYEPPVDLWSAGCIMAELWTKSPILKGNSEQDQLQRISALCGSINPSVWPDVTKFESHKNLEQRSRKLRNRLGPFLKNKWAIDLVDKLLMLDPSRRIGADAALEHTFFFTRPDPCNLEKVVSKHHENMLKSAAANQQHETSNIPTKSDYGDGIF